MKNNTSGTNRNSVLRLVVVALFLLLQISWIIVMLFHFNQLSVWGSSAAKIIGILLALNIVNKNSNAAFKLPWVILILVSPVGGLVLYLIAGRSGITKKRHEKLSLIGDSLRSRYLTENGALCKEDEDKRSYACQMRYIRNDSNYPAYSDTETRFYSDTCKALDELINALEKAEKFIFMEYHAIEEAEAFGRIKSVLQEKAENGVEVRIIYDDMGSVGFLNLGFRKKMKECGIECRVFNPMMPVINVFMNNRDHRKITVIDGKVGFTGGYNLADEYFNIVQPYGEWKDSGLRLEGNAVRNLTVQFLEMWNTIENTDKEFDKYFPKNISRSSSEKGIVQPYGDCPLDDIYLGENVYMNMLSEAKDYIWFMTPYLIISDEMRRAITLASRRGVDVRILTPGIPDKKFVYKMTRSYYHQLVKSGVRIYEFTPGFLHAKQCISDDRTAVVGTINLDFRSLYFHFENAVLFADCDAVSDVKADFENTMPRCCEVTEKYMKEPKEARRIINQIMRLFSPLF